MHIFNTLFAAGIILACSSAAFAGDWKMKRGAGPIPAETGQEAPNGLPDGLVAVSPESTDLRSAWYTQPTTRYRHGILGDIIEAGGIAVADANGVTQELTLPEELVFEDRTPRLIDLDGFGKTHIVTIIAHREKGAAIAVFGLVDGELRMLDQTPFIGRSNRWRNVAGFADFDGDGHLQIAEVVTPHIGGTLRFWTWNKGKLDPSGDIFGFSNHFIGSREQRLSVVDDFNDDGKSDIALPDASRRNLRIIGFEGKAREDKQVIEIATIPLPARIDKAMDIRVEVNKPIITIGLDDGSIWDVHRP